MLAAHQRPPAAAAAAERGPGSRRAEAAQRPPAVRAEEIGFDMILSQRKAGAMQNVDTMCLSKHQAQLLTGECGHLLACSVNRHTCHAGNVAAAGACSVNRRAAAPCCRLQSGAPGLHLRLHPPCMLVRIVPAGGAKLAVQTIHAAKALHCGTIHSQDVLPSGSVSSSKRSLASRCTASLRRARNVPA